VVAENQLRALNFTLSANPKRRLCLRLQAEIQPPQNLTHLQQIFVFKDS
jgi:hypothetical protein